MDREKFIEKFNTASDTLDMDHINTVISDCINRLYDKYHENTKPMIVISTMEESGEYIQALSQRMRGRVEDNYDILQEIGDNILDMLCIGRFFGISHEDIRKAINVKIDREADRIEQHKQGLEVQ